MHAPPVRNRKMTRFVFATGLAYSVLSCATQQKPGAPSGPIGVTQLYPVAVGNAWAHMVTDHETSQQVLVTSRISATTATSFTVISGDEIIEYVLKDGGIFKPKSGYFMMIDPITEGARWPISSGGEVRVERMNATDTVTAGTFEGCVVIVEEVGGEQRAEWTYAPHVGPIRMRVWTLLTPEPTLVMSGELRGYDVAEPS